MNRIASRLARLERNVDPGGGGCDGPATITLRHAAGEASPAIPADARRCGRCGEVHPLFEVLVRTREEARSCTPRTSPTACAPWSAGCRGTARRTARCAASAPSC